MLIYRQNYQERYNKSCMWKCQLNAVSTYWEYSKKLLQYVHKHVKSIHTFCESGYQLHLWLQYSHTAPAFRNLLEIPLFKKNFYASGRQTRPEGHFKVCATITYFARGRCHLLMGLKQGCIPHSPYGCRLGYHPSEAWLVEQKALPPSVLLLDTNWDSNPHAADQTPELESCALNR